MGTSKVIVAIVNEDFGVEKGESNQRNQCSGKETKPHAIVSDVAVRPSVPSISTNWIWIYFPKGHQSLLRHLPVCIGFAFRIVHSFKLKESGKFYDQSPHNDANQIKSEFPVNLDSPMANS